MSTKRTKIKRRGCACAVVYTCEFSDCSLSMADIPLLSSAAASSSSGSTPARPRKRKRRPETWARNVEKRKRAKGEEYVSTSTGATVEAVMQGPPCSCRQKCFHKFAEAELKKVFTCFWQLGDKGVQDAYLHGLIWVRKVIRRRPRKSTPSRTPRSASYTYVVRASPLHVPCMF
jgi:hypothetical protein